MFLPKKVFVSVSLLSWTDCLYDNMLLKIHTFFCVGFGFYKLNKTLCCKLLHSTASLQIFDHLRLFEESELSIKLKPPNGVDDSSMG